MTADPARTALITGASGGIGRAAVNHFAASGWRVVGLDRAAFGKAFPKDGLFIEANLSDPESISSALTQVEGFTSELHALVNNAAVQVAKPFLETSLEEWEEVMAVNLRAAFLITQRAYPLLKAAHGAVVNVSSVHAVATSGSIAAYAASKGALLALTRALAIEFAPDNVRVNAVLPGAVDTAMLDTGLARGHASGASLAERKADLARKTVLGRVGTPEEIAHAIYFLADNAQSSFMTGQSLTVDGGATARLSTE